MVSGRAGKSCVGLTLVLIAALSGAARAADGNAPSALLNAAIDHFYNLQFDEAQKEIEACLAAQPGDLRALNLLASDILQREMMRRELLEVQSYARRGEAYRDGKPDVDPQTRKQLYEVLGRTEKIASEHLQVNPGDTDALYWLGASHVTRALFLLTLEKAKMDALGEAKEARKLHGRVLDLDPNYTDALLVVGMYDYIAGSLPWYTKIFAAIAGVHGNRERGLEEMRQVTEKGRWTKTDALSFLAVLYYREKRYADAIGILADLQRKYPRNFLLPQEIARAYKAQNNWHAAAEAYDSILKNRENGGEGFGKIPAAKIYFQAGEAFAQAGDKQTALERYEKAASIKEKNPYVYRSELAAAGLELERNNPADAKRRYLRVARDVPSTDEGRAAARSLQAMTSSPGAR